MIDSTILRLTLSYLSIIMLLSISFSVALHQIYRAQLVDDMQRQPVALLQGIVNFDSYQVFRAEQFARNMTRIQQNLVLLNVAMLGVGGVVSYLLARRTLLPIADSLEAQRRFTADASHELRTPLAAMQAEIEVALRNADLSKEEAVQLLVSNLEEVAKLQSLSEGLLTLAQTDAKDALIESLTMTRIVNGVLDRMEPMAKKKHITVKRRLNTVVVRGVEHNLAEVVTVLVDNAIKYSPKKTTITVELRRHRKMAVLVVADEGYGIKPADVPHIFDRFYRSDLSRSKGVTPGYGLGLSIARKIVVDHEGSIEVKSEESKGTRFIVRLPLATG